MRLHSRVVSTRSVLWIIAQHLPSFSGEGGGAGSLPATIAGPFSDAMAQTMLLPPAVLVLGLVAVLFFERPRHAGYAARQAAPAASAATVAD